MVVKDNRYAGIIEGIVIILIGVLLFSTFLELRVPIVLIGSIAFLLVGLCFIYTTKSMTWVIDKERGTIAMIDLRLLGLIKYQRNYQIEQFVRLFLQICIPAVAGAGQITYQTVFVMSDGTSLPVDRLQGEWLRFFSKGEEVEQKNAEQIASFIGIPLQVKKSFCPEQ